jgi:hypothetical protein
MSSETPLLVNIAGISRLSDAGGIGWFFCGHKEQKSLRATDIRSATNIYPLSPRNTRNNRLARKEKRREKKEHHKMRSSYYSASEIQDNLTEDRERQAWRQYSLSTSRTGRVLGVPTAAFPIRTSLWLAPSASGQLRRVSRLRHAPRLARIGNSPHPSRRRGAEAQEQVRRDASFGLALWPAKATSYKHQQQHIS